MASRDLEKQRKYSRDYRKRKLATMSEDERKTWYREAGRRARLNPNTVAYFRAYHAVYQPAYRKSASFLLRQSEPERVARRREQNRLRYFAPENVALRQTEAWKVKSRALHRASYARRKNSALRQSEEWKAHDRAMHQAAYVRRKARKAS